MIGGCDVGGGGGGGGSGGGGGDGGTGWCAQEGAWRALTAAVGLLLDSV